MATFEYALILAMKMKQQNTKVTKIDQERKRTALKLDVAALIVIPVGFFIIAFAFWYQVKD